MRLHVETLFTSGGDGRLLAVNEPRGGTAPRFFLGRTADCNQWWFRHDIDATLANDMSTICDSLPTGMDVTDAAPLIARLSHEQPVTKTWAGPAFHFPSDFHNDQIAIRMTSDNIGVLSPYFDDWCGDVAAGVPMAVVLESGKAVSVCCSVRVTTQAHEAGVETHPDFRGRGYAAPAVSEWARIVREINCIPLYSTSWENLSSRALAKKLGLIQFGSDLHIT